MGGRIYALDRRDIALYRRGLLASLHLRSDKSANRVELRRQIGLANQLAIRLEIPRTPEVARECIMKGLSQALIARLIRRHPEILGHRLGCRIARGLDEIGSRREIE